MSAAAPPRSPRYALIPALLIVAAYMAARFVIYAFMAEVRVRAAQTAPGIVAYAWFFQDLLVTIPRLLALGACFWASRRLSESGPRWRGFQPEAGGLLLAALAGELIAVGAFRYSASTPALLMTAMTFATVVVALWEELCFRGLLYPALRERSPVFGAVVSSLLFMAYHIQALPPRWIALTFFVGLLLCAAYERGAGLWTLAAVHFLIDEIGLFFMGPFDRPRLFTVGAALLVLAALAAMRRLAQPAATSSLSPAALTSA